MRVLWRMIVKEFLQLRQDKKLIPMLFVGPLFQLLALGYAANLDVSDIPMLVVDQDRSRASRDLLERFVGSGYFRVVGTEDTVDRVEPWLVDNRAQLALVVAAGYGDAVAAGRVPRLQMIADGTDSNSAVVGLGYASRIVAELGASLLETRMLQAPRPGTGRGRHRSRAPRLLQPRPAEPLVLRARGGGHGPHARDHDPALHGGGAREGDRHPRADHRDASPVVAAHRGQARALRGDRDPGHAAGHRGGAPALRGTPAGLTAAADVPHPALPARAPWASASSCRPWCAPSSRP